MQVASTYSTVAEATAMTIAGLIPVALLAREQKTIRNYKKEDSMKGKSLRKMSREADKSMA